MDNQRMSTLEVWLNKHEDRLSAVVVVSIALLILTALITFATSEKIVLDAEAASKKEAQIKSFETLGLKLPTQDNDVVGGSK